MKVSLNWVKQFIDFELPPVDELVERIGAQLGAVEEVEDLGAKYKGVLVAKVVECVDHPDSDHLHLCKIDDGGRAEKVLRDSNGLVQVVCGAPNVRAGLTVAWLPPEATVPESVGRAPFVLEAREIRGQMSSGMLASPRELALGDGHEGILEIDKDAKPGDDFASVYKLDDYVIDIENKMFTHRPDCFGVLGVAREIAGILHKPFKSPEWYQPKPQFPGKEADLPLKISNELPELVPRFSAVTLADIKLGQSPEWLQVALAKVGQKSINNVVDLTNFYMLVTSQPLHAYDYDKVKALTDGEAAEITVRHPRQGEKIKLLNGKEIEPRDEAIMIASGNHLIGVGGVMGGSATEVDENTKNIILEAANFDMYSIRRTSMAHGLFTDAVTRFNKGQSPLQTLAILAKITGDIQKMAGGKVASELIDVSQIGDRQWVHPPVTVTTDFINSRLGLHVSAEEMKTLLENVECSVAVEGEQLTVTAPFWRTDIETREDVVEEVGRLYGFDKLPLELPRRSIKPASKDPLLELKSRVREILSRAGANEVLTYSFVHGDLLQKTGQNPEDAFRVGNALSPELQYYRLSLAPSLLEKIHPNVKAGYDEFALFEMGKVHSKSELDEEGLPKEFERLSLVFAAEPKMAQKRYGGAAFFEARKFADALRIVKDRFTLIPLERADFKGHELSKQMVAPYEPKRAAAVHDGERIVGVIGEYRRSVERALKLPDFCAGFEVFLSALESSTGGTYRPLPRFPKVTQDITLKVPAEVRYQALTDFLQAQLNVTFPDQTRPNLSPLDMYQREDDVNHKQMTFRLHIASYERTLTDQGVNELLDKVAAAAKEKFGAERI